MNTDNKDDQYTLEILGFIENQKHVTQRHLAQKLGVALGLTNSYLKKCVKRGYVKIKQAPARRFAYYLTPKGFAEKSRLTAAFLTRSFDFYRQASESCLNSLLECKNNGHHEIVLCGISELAEICLIKSKEAGVKVIGFYDAHKSIEKHLGVDVIKKPDDKKHQVFLLTDLKDPAGRYTDFVAQHPNKTMIVPDIIEQYLNVE
jgi:predicted transcriptional regulator